MQFQKFSISIILATLAVSAQQHAATANPRSASHASTKYELTLQKMGIQTIQSQAIPSQTTQFQSQKSISTDQAGQTFFSQPLYLVRAAVFPDQDYVPSTYEFTLTIPKDAGQPLKAVTITQATNVETVQFDVTRSKVFNSWRAAGSEIQLASVGGNQPSNVGEVMIVFDQPVLPGNTVTIVLAARRNPIGSGVYQFGVAAYPDGENSLGQFLGYGRINFHGNSN
jgi:hypothetical protein